MFFDSPKLAELRSKYPKQMVEVFTPIPLSTDNFAITVDPNCCELVTMKRISQSEQGKNNVTLELEGGAELPYSLDLTYKTEKPITDKDCPIEISTSMNKKSLAMGEIAILKVKVKNLKNEGQAMTLARVGIPEDDRVV